MAQLEAPVARPTATLDAVAREAGVSRATVSRVVNGSPKVSPEVRRNVERVIDRLGYTPNRAARSLVTRRSESVAVVITTATSHSCNKDKRREPSPNHGGASLQRAGDPVSSAG